LRRSASISRKFGSEIDCWKPSAASFQIASISLRAECSRMCWATARSSSSLPWTRALRWA
jgi:hypothetical protein